MNNPGTLDDRAGACDDSRREGLPVSRCNFPIPLSNARCGERLRVVGVRDSSPACIRLKEMGFCESAEVCKVVDGSAVICQMLGVRLAIGRALSCDVMVEPLVEPLLEEPASERQAHQPVEGWERLAKPLLKPVQRAARLFF